MKDMISIIIPVYNREALIEECIESVFAQSYQNFEIIIIDDGSTDKTLEICEKLVQNDSRIKLLFGTHAGVSSARNKGLDAARGEYIFFVDSDDIIHPKLVETLLTGMKNTGATIAGTTALYFSEKNWDIAKQKVKLDSQPGETIYYNHEDALHTVFHTSSPFQVMGGMMFCRDLIGDTRFRTDLFIGEDFYFSYQNLIKGAAVVFLKQRWYYHRWDDKNSSNNFSFDAFWSRFYRRELVWKSEENFGREEYVNLQKKSAFDVFMGCLQKNKLGSEYSRKMRKQMKKYRKILFPALNTKDKIRYCVSVYSPWAYLTFFRLKEKITKKTPMF